MNSFPPRNKKCLISTGFVLSEPPDFFQELHILKPQEAVILVQVGKYKRTHRQPLSIHK